MYLSEGPIVVAALLKEERGEGMGRGLNAGTNWERGVFSVTPARVGSGGVGLCPHCTSTVII